jgi:hypothetical protein
LAAILRAVASGGISARVALGRVPAVEDPENVPKTWGSAVVELERQAQEIEHFGDLLDPYTKAWFSSTLTKLADRLELKGNEP